MANVKSANVETAIALKHLLVNDNRKHVLRRVGLEFEKAAAYEISPEEYGKTYKSKKNGRDLVAYVNGNELQALIYGRNFTSEGIVSEPCWNYNGTRSYSYFARHSDRLVVIPQEVILALQEQRDEKRAARRKAQRVDGPERLSERLRAFKRDKAGKLDSEALVAASKEGVRYLFDLIAEGRTSRYSLAVHRALRGCKHSVRDLDDLVRNLMADVAHVREHEGRVAEYTAKLDKAKDDYDVRRYTYSLDDATEALKKAKLDLKVSVADYELFRTKFTAAPVVTVDEDDED